MMSGIPYSHPDSSAQFKKRKSRFTFHEVHLLLSEVERNRHILVGKFNQGIPSDVKKRTWASLTARINEISDCHREIIEVVKKWADMKCDTMRKVAAMRASGLSPARITGKLSRVERMVQQILMPGTGEKVPHMSTDNEEEKEVAQGVPIIAAHLSGTANGNQPIPTQDRPLYGGLNSQEELGVPVDCDSAVTLIDLQFHQSDREDSNMLYSETRHKSGQNFTPILDSPSADKEQILTETKHCSSSSTKTSDGKSSNSTIFHLPLSAPSSLSSHLAQSSSLSLQEQQATTLLIGTLSRSLESVADSVQSLVRTQQEFIQDTLRLQRDTLHVLRDFSSSALDLLLDKSNGRP